MNAQQMAEALETWATDTVPALQGSYPYATGEKSEALPDVIVHIERVRLLNSGDRSTSQTLTRVFNARLSLMVENSIPEAAEESLREFQALLEAAIVDSPAVAGADVIPDGGTLAEFEFTPFVEYDDGTRGRELQLVLTLAELVQQ